MDQFIREWLASGRSAGWSERTAATYGWYVRRFAGWCAERAVLRPDQITRALLREWGLLIRSAWAPATCKGAVAAVRSWCSFLEDEGLAVDLAGALRVPVVPRARQRTLTAGEFERILYEAGRDRRCVRPEVSTWLAVRDRAIVSLLYDSLVRASELCALCVGDVRTAELVLIVKRGKGGAGRLAYYSVGTAGELMTWLALRGPVDPAAPLFITEEGKALTARSLRQLVVRLGRRAGVADVSPHAFRRGGAVAAVLAGCPGRLLQIAGGWSDARMIESYTRALEGESATRDAWLRFSPVSLAAK